MGHVKLENSHKSFNFSVWKQARRCHQLRGRSQLLQEERPQGSCRQPPKGLKNAREEFILKETDVYLSFRQLTFTQTWGGSPLQRSTMRRLQESLSPR